jgi:hypothetical protein
MPAEVKSRPSITDAPVVVSPDIASKNESVSVVVLLEKMKGRAEKNATINQLRAVSKKVSRTDNLRGPTGLLAKISINPEKIVIAIEMANACQFTSSCKKSTKRGGSIARERAERKSPDENNNGCSDNTLKAL